MTNLIIARLDQLAEYQAQWDVLALDQQALIDGILTPEIKARIREIEARFAPHLEAVSTAQATLEAEIKADVLRRAAEEEIKDKSVKGAWLHAVWSKGRVSWDTRGLDGYAKAHPEIETFRQEGLPSVSIRRL